MDIWIKRTAAVTAIMGGVVGAVATAVTAAGTWSETRIKAAEVEVKQAELRLKDAEQRHAVRMAYLTMTTGGRLKADVQRVLRYIRAVDDQEAVGAWPKAEISLIDREFEKLEKQLESARAESEELRRKVKDAESRRAAGEADRYLAQLHREQQKVFELEHLVGRVQVPKRCVATSGGVDMESTAHTEADCMRKVRAHCTKYQGKCTFTWDGLAGELDPATDRVHP